MSDQGGSLDLVSTNLRAVMLLSGELCYLHMKTADALVIQSFAFLLIEGLSIIRQSVQDTSPRKA